MPVNEVKFSVLAYSGSRQEEEEGRIEDESIRSRTQNRHLDQVVEEARAYVIGYEGGNDRDKRRHHEMLNRAVLGFSEERKLLFAMIQDFLLKKRWFSEGSPDGRFSSLAEAVFSEIIGLNVLELLLKNKEDLEEIQVVGKKIYEVRRGIAKPSIYSFRSVEDVERLQQNLVLFNQDTLNIRKRWAEVRLSDGARVTLTGFGYTAEPTLTIRFYNRELLSLEALCDPRLESMDHRTMRLLRGLVRSAVNLVIVGPTNSGKTQLLKALIAEMPDEERIVTMESRFELMLQRDFPSKNIVQYEVTEEDPLHDGLQAFKLALRQSPKRIVHAEIRDEDANLYVRACTRGHDGSITTLHASRLEDVPDAIADMCLMDGRAINHERLVKRITEQVTHVGIELSLIQGKRRIVRVGEYEYENGGVAVRTLSAYDKSLGKWVLSKRPSAQLSAKLLGVDPGWEEIYEEYNRCDQC